MKSSTIRRSTLSKESMEVIETLAKEQEGEGSLGEYVRPDEVQAANDSSKSQEIDLLWQNFKPAQFTTNSPAMNILLGFGLGVLTTVVIAGLCVNGYLKSHDIKAKAVPVQENILDQQTDNSVDAKVVLPSDNEVVSQEGQVSDSAIDNSANTIDTSNMKKYIVQSGDTVEGIIKKHYGSYSPEKAELIMNANKLESLDRLQIDQELLIPAP